MIPFSKNMTPDIFRFLKKCLKVHWFSFKNKIKIIIKTEPNMVELLEKEKGNL